MEETIPAWQQYVLETSDLLTKAWQAIDDGDMELAHGIGERIAGIHFGPAGASAPPHEQNDVCLFIQLVKAHALFVRWLKDRDPRTHTGLIALHIHNAYKNMSDEYKAVANLWMGRYRALAKDLMTKDVSS